MKFSTVEDVREKIEELQEKIAELTANIESAENNPSDYCISGHEESALNCDEDCTDCAQGQIDEWTSERDEAESDQDELQKQLEKLEQDESLADHLLENNSGDVDEAIIFIERRDYSVWDSWEDYVRDFIENNYSDLPPLIANNLDLEAIGNELSMCEQWEEIGCKLYIFY